MSESNATLTNFPQVRCYCSGMKSTSKKKDSHRSRRNKTAPATKQRILVVEDEEPFREIISSILTTAGYHCRTAGDGLDALDVLNSGEEFELLLTNLVMPNLDGIGLLERTKEQFPDMPVVVETATHDVSVALATIRNGAYDCLLKPFEREQLLTLVHRVMEYRRLKLENRGYKERFGTLANPVSHEPQRILLQHNDEPIREICASMLTTEGYECRQAASPAEALKILKSEKGFALLICKVMESLEENLFERISKSVKDIPVVVWGCRPFSVFSHALREGAYDYLAVPFEREQLSNVVHRALEHRRLKLENRAYLRLMRTALTKKRKSR
jgi:DNA-binding NtrC family response regulator